MTIIAMDAFALRIVLRPLRTAAAGRGVSLLTHLKRSTDSVAVTIVVGGACAVIVVVVAGAGLVASQFMGSATPDTVASAFIGLLLLVASVLLLHTHRELLTGRGVPPAMTSEMRRVVAAQPGVLDVPDLFAVVIGPASLIVVGDVTFADELDVPRVEAMIMQAANELRERWPAIDYVYLTPVPQARFSRRAPWLRPRAAAHHSPGPPLRGRLSGPAESRPGSHILLDPRTRQLKAMGSDQFLGATTAASGRCSTNHLRRRSAGSAATGRPRG